MNIKSSIFWLAILVFSVAACSKEESPANLPKGEPIISAKIGDEHWIALDYESAVNVIPGRGQFFELESFNNKYRVDLSVLEFDSSSGTISEGTYEDNIFFSVFIIDEERNLQIVYKPMEGDEDMQSPFIIEIIASTNSRISGTFSGVVERVSQEGEGNYPEKLVIANGIFNNLPFETHTVNIQ